MKTDMNDTPKQEAAYQVNDASILHLQETDDGCRYAAFDMASKTLLGEGTIPQDAISDSSARSSLAAFREKVLDSLGMDGGKIAPVSVRMLEPYRESQVHLRMIFKPETLPQKDIRFIDSSYKDLFRLPDGGSVTVQYPDRQFSARCEHIDPYHTRVGTEVFHICQFAELLERNHGTVQPEPESMASEMGWRLGINRYLTLQSNEDGWKFNFYDDKFKEMAMGTLEKPELSINEARNAVMADQRMRGRTMTKLGFEFIEERADKARQESRESVIGKLDTMKSGAGDRQAPAPRKQPRTER